MRQNYVLLGGLCVGQESFFKDGILVASVTSVRSLVTAQVTADIYYFNFSVELFWAKFVQHADPSLKYH